MNEDFLNPPYTNGVMILTDKEKIEIKAKLQEIKEGFTPSMEQPVIDTFYIVAKYNEENEFKINGDTAEFLLNEQEQVGE